MYLYKVGLHGDGGNDSTVLLHKEEYSEQQFHEILLQAIEKSFLQEKETFLKTEHTAEMFPLMKVTFVDIYESLIKTLQTDFGFEEGKFAQQMSLSEDLPNTFMEDCSPGGFEGKVVDTLTKLNDALFAEKYPAESKKE